jgi:hypothetical protein
VHPLAPFLVGLAYDDDVRDRGILTDRRLDLGPGKY